MLYRLNQLFRIVNDYSWIAEARMLWHPPLFSPLPRGKKERVYLSKKEFWIVTHHEEAAPMPEVCGHPKEIG